MPLSSVGSPPTSAASQPEACTTLAAAERPTDDTRNTTATERVTKDMPLEGTYAPSTSGWARDQAELIEATNGAEGSDFRGMGVIVLTTVGAKTGLLRKTALMRVEHDGAYAVVASLGGAPKHPVWYFNIIKNHQVELQDRAVKRDYLAREITGAEKQLGARSSGLPSIRGLSGGHPAADSRTRLGGLRGIKAVSCGGDCVKSQFPTEGEETASSRPVHRARVRCWHRGGHRFAFVADREGGSRRRELY